MGPTEHRASGEVRSTRVTGLGPEVRNDVTSESRSPENRSPENNFPEVRNDVTSESRSPENRSPENRSPENNNRENNNETVSPGDSPQTQNLQQNPRTQQTQESVNQTLANPYQRFYPVTTLDTTYQLYGGSYCRRCDFPRPLRAHHCSTTGKCILRMDHYCPISGNTIGWNNHKYFLLFCLYSALGNFLFIVTFIPEVVTGLFPGLLPENSGMPENSGPENSGMSGTTKGKMSSSESDIRMRPSNSCRTSEKLAAFFGTVTIRGTSTDTSATRNAKGQAASNAKGSNAAGNHLNADASNAKADTASTNSDLAHTASINSNLVHFFLFCCKV